MKTKIQLKIIILALGILHLTMISFGQQEYQRRCGSGYFLDQVCKNNPSLKDKIISQRAQKIKNTLSSASLRQASAESELTISVVIHIVLPDPSVVTNAQIDSQMVVLNRTYAGLNADSNKIPAAFRPLFGKSKIRFCLASRDPDNQLTNGILRVASSTASNSSMSDPVKYTGFGGSDAWNTELYLNIWVCKTEGDFLGYSYTPEIVFQGIIPKNELGVVVKETAFGIRGSARSPYNLGKTVVHEVGHFLNLEHIWGPNNCDQGSCSDDDDIEDTPLQFTCTRGEPRTKTVLDQCTSEEPGIMWMNYMDYVDDNSMFMFTPDQIAVMESTFTSYEWMNKLANSGKCSFTTSVTNNSADKLNELKIYPNPVSNQLTVYKPQENKPLQYRILNVYGQEMMRGFLNNDKTSIDISRFSQGVYYFHTNLETIKVIKK